MGGNYAGIPAACFADDRGGGGGGDEYDDDEHDDDEHDDDEHDGQSLLMPHHNVVS